MSKEATECPDLFERVEIGDIEMGVYPVLFGFRVRAGKIGDSMYFIDWCCGADPLCVWISYAVLKKLLQEGRKDIPNCSEVKPWPKDVTFAAWFWHEFQQVQPIEFKRFDLQSMREQVLNEAFNEPANTNG